MTSLTTDRYDVTTMGELIDRKGHRRFIATFAANVLVIDQQALVDDLNMLERIRESLKPIK